MVKDGKNSLKFSSIEVLSKFYVKFYNQIFFEKWFSFSYEKFTNKALKFDKTIKHIYEETQYSI